MKQKTKKEIKTVLTARVKPSVKKKAEEKAGKNGTTVSAVVESKLIEYIS